MINEIAGGRKYRHQNIPNAIEEKEREQRRDQFERVLLVGVDGADDEEGENEEVVIVIDDVELLVLLVLW